MSDSKVAVGRKAEQAVCDYLTSKGYDILTRNYTRIGGEIDLIAKQGIYIVFVEVKYRDDHTLVDPLYAITKPKMGRIRKTAQHYLMTFNLDLQPRFDVVTVVGDIDRGFYRFDHIENAF